MAAVSGFILTSVLERATWTVTAPLSTQECTGRFGQLLERIRIEKFAIFHIRSRNKTLRGPPTPKA